MLERRGSGTPVIARLRPGVTVAEARVALDAVDGGAGRIHGPTPGPARVVIKSMCRDETSQFGATIQTLSLAVGLGPGHRLRQRRGSDAGARRDPARGAGYSCGNRRRTGPSDPASCSPRACCWLLLGAVAGVLLAYGVARRPGRAHPAVTAGQFAGGNQCEGARVRARAHRADRPALWPDAGAQALPRAEDDRHDARAADAVARRCRNGPANG